MGETIGQREIRMTLNRVLRRNRNAPLWQAAVQAAASSRYVGHSETKDLVTTLKFSSRDDGKVTLKIRIPSGFIATFEDGDNAVWRESWRCVADHFGLHGLIQDLRKALPALPYLQEVDLLVERMREEASPFFDQILSAVRSLGGEYAERAEAGKIRGLIDSLRGEVRDALSNGVSREQILMILDEETVKSVQEE